MRRAKTIAAIALVAAVGCKGPSEDRAGGVSTSQESKADPWAAEEPAQAAPMELEEGRMGKQDEDQKRRKEVVDRARSAGVLGAGQGSGYGVGGGRGGFAPGAPPADDHAKTPEGPTRAWFPETFLFEPLVVTDDGGSATVRVRVPDRLTTWRVLALAHARTGAQGGTTARFLGTLPTYVDLVVPEVLVRGDEVRLPIQIVNTTDAPVTAALTLEVDHATVTGGGATRTVPANGSVIEYARLRADRAGTITLRAGLRGGDAVIRTIDVVPAGQPVTTTRSGTLAAPRTLTIDAPAGSDPATDRARLLVFPGALALLRSELSASTARGGVADDAYALLLAGRAPALLTALGGAVEPDVLRTLAIVTSQRAIRAARTLDVERATLLTEAALAHEGNPVLTRLGERAAAYLVQQQRPDGTFGGGDGWTLQRVLVTTAAATRAARTAMTTSAGTQRALNVSIRAAGAFERNAAQITDGYTAAAMLASGAVTGPLVDTLRARVKDALKPSTDGAQYLAIDDGVVRPDGARPTVAEATALAALALAGDPTAPVADLGATLLGSYDPARGWGDGRTNLIAMLAVLALFETPIPPDVKITLTMDGKPVAEGVLAADKLRDVLALDVPAPGLAGAHTWAITATPAVAGLGYSLALSSWVPWQPSPTRGGLELSLLPSVTATVGAPTELTVRAIAPSGVPLTITHALPAGVQVDTPSLDALVSAGALTSYEVATGKVTLEAPALQPGATFAATYRVIPTLAGSLRSPPSTLAAGGTEIPVPPTSWVIR